MNSHLTKLTCLFLLILASGCSPKAASVSRAGHAPVHLPPDASTTELKNAVVQSQLLMTANTSPADEEFYKQAYTMGERLSKWLANINAQMPAGMHLSLWSPETLSGIPIDAPDDRTHYSIPRVQSRIESYKKNAPAEMVKVIFGTDEIPSQTTVAEADFLTWGRLIDKAYQTAMRLQALSAYQDYYASASRNDLRGIYFLSHLATREAELKNFDSQDSSEQTKLKEWLIEMCMNAASENDAHPRNACTTELSSQIKIQADLNQFYNKYFQASQDEWDSYFKIPEDGARSDVAWSNEMLTIPFVKTSLQKVNDYLTINIQDEWKWTNWQLKLNFQDNDNGSTPHIVFKAGALPHVNAVGGNTITMDGNMDLDAWDAQWTIRHEFGHVLGFVDCYLEFYDTDSKEMINYQLDVSDLMCSRKGKMKERLFTELKRVYAK